MDTAVVNEEFSEKISVDVVKLVSAALSMCCKIQQVCRGPMLPAKIIIGKSPVSTNADGLISLTDLYEAKAVSQSSLLGRLSIPLPDEWTRKAEVGQRMLRVADELGVHPSEVLKREGVNMYAHLVIALDYARAIDLKVEVVEDKPEPTTPALPAKLLIGDKPVATNGDGLVSLTDLWRASGVQNPRPADWLRQPVSAKFISAVADEQGVVKYHIVQSQKGRGVFAHYQVALAYAKALSPELHMAVNEVFMRYKAGDPTLAEEVIEKVEDPAALERIERRARAKKHVAIDTVNAHR